MEISKKLNDVKKAQEIVEQMIESARAQKVTNVDILFTLNRSLADISSSSSKIHTDKHFLNTWNHIMAWSDRVFEGHPLLDLLNDIDTQLKLKH